MTSANIEIGWGYDHHRHEEFARHPSKEKAEPFIEQFPRGNARWVGVLDVPLNRTTEHEEEKKERREK